MRYDNIGIKHKQGQQTFLITIRISFHAIH